MPTLQNTDDSKTNLNKYIYKYTLFLDWKIQYCYQFSLKMIYRFNIISTKISAGFFIKIYRLILKCIQEGQRTRITKTVLKKQKAGRLTPPNFKT